MEDNKTVDTVGTEEVTTETNPDTNNDVITMSKADYDKAIQSAEDKLRTKYSKEIKALETKVSELTPAQKTEAEIALEKRLAALELKEKQTEEKEKLLNLQTALQAHGLDVALADYLTLDVDADAFSEVIEKVVAAKISASGYKPTGHQNNQPITRAEYDKMTYEQKAELFRQDPTIRERFKN